MRICVNNYRAVTLAAMMAMTVSACKKPVNLVPVSKDYIQPRTTAILDSLANEGKKITENTDYIYLGSDTLELNKDFSKNPAKFLNKASMIVRDKFDDKVCTKKDNYIPGYPDCVSTKRYSEFKDMYIDKTTIIPNAKTYTKDSTDIYVPVEYYGRVNPEIQNFL